MPEFDLDAALTVPVRSAELQSGRWTVRLVTNQGQTDYPRAHPSMNVDEAAWCLDYDGTTVGRGDFPFDNPNPGETFDDHCNSIWELAVSVLENVRLADEQSPYPGPSADFWLWADEHLPDLYV